MNDASFSFVYHLEQIIDAYARIRHVEVAEEILSYMIESFNSGDKSVKPDCFTFNAV